MAGHPVQWLKIDVEGDELAVLQGAPETIATVRCLLVENNDPAVPRLLAELGFACYGITRRGLCLDGPSETLNLFYRRG